MRTKIILYQFFYIIGINCVQTFSNYTFYEIIAFNDHERDLLYNIQQTHGNIHFLNGITNEAAIFMNVIVDSCCTLELEQRLTKFGIEYSRVTNKSTHSFNKDITNNLQQKNSLQTFLNWDDILLWVENKIHENPILTKTVIAKTFKHRDIFVLKLSVDKTDKKMAIFMVAGEEGRDWLSSAILLNYINKLLEGASISESLLNYYDMYFVPIFNPDGFVYSKNENRMWVKNRKTIQLPESCVRDGTAVGVNIDRNWFIKTPDSTNPCYSIYSGSKALSEEETQGLSYILNSIALKLLAFINLRGFGNLITLPNLVNKEDLTNLNIMMEIMKHTSAVLKMQYNKNYPVGTSASYFYNFSGNMPDWVKNKLNIPVVFTVYMQHDNFLPKESHILPLTEQFDSLQNISLIICKEIYGSLYNTQKKYASNLILNIICFICICTVK